MATDLIEPHGGTLVNLLVDANRADELKLQSRHWASWTLTPRQVCDLELMITGAFSPLMGFLGRADYQSVCETMRLADGTLWPVPVMLDVNEEIARGVAPGEKLALRDTEGYILGVLTVADVWKADLGAEAEKVYGTAAPEHPGVACLNRCTGPWYVGGSIEALAAPKHYDFAPSRLTPAEVRQEFARRRWRSVVAFHTRRPMHRAEQEQTARAAADLGAGLLIHAAVGMTLPGEVDPYTRLRCYQAVLSHYPPGAAMMSLLTLAPRLAGPREAVWHAIIRKNYGCSHLIAGPDCAVELARHEAELGVTAAPAEPRVYLPGRDACVPADDAGDGAKAMSLSDAELREYLADGREIPAWFSFPEVVRQLQATYPPRSRQGFTVFFTGLSGSGKSTIANVLAAKLLEIGGRPVTLWDGDIVRTNLSSELGFSREHRDINIRRIGFVAAQDTKNGGIAICAPIAPYAAARQANRELISSYGGYILVHVATSVAVCEQRDTKGLYAKARAGIITEFTGISDPYEPPDDADLVLDTVETTPEQCAEQVIAHLRERGYLERGEV